MLLVLFCVHVNPLCTLYLYSFLVVVYRGPHGRLAFLSLNVLPSENKDYYYLLLLLFEWPLKTGFTVIRWEVSQSLNVNQQLSIKG